MKAYKVNKYTQRVAAYLLAVRWPFKFDGEFVEFTASSSFVSEMQKEDPKFRDIAELNV